MRDYKYLRAWCRMMGSYPYYVEAELEAARRDKAPNDVVYRSSGMDGRPGEWRRFTQITDRHTRETIARLVAELEASNAS